MSTHSRALVLTVTGVVTALTLLAAPAQAEPLPVAETQDAALYCVDKDPDAVLGRQLHPGFSFCVPVPA